MHALSIGQSWFITHSGRQLGGEPIISGKQEHWHLSPMTLGGLELGPQGFGSHGSSMTGCIAKIYNLDKMQCMQFLLTFWFQSTCSERITNVSLDASTSWDMILDSTVGIHPTSPRTWINAVQLLTCFV